MWVEGADPSDGDAMPAAGLTCPGCGTGGPNAKPRLRIWVPLDKNEGVVKAQNSRAVFFHRFDAQSGGEPKLRNSHGESACGGPYQQIVPPTIDTA